MKEFKPKTRTQIYKAALGEVLTPDDVPSKVERYSYENKEDGQPTVNIPVSFEAATGAVEGSYVAKVSTYNGIAENNEVFLNDVPVEEYDESKTYSAGDLFFVTGKETEGYKRWNYIGVVSFQAEPAAADYVISAYSVFSVPDMAAIQPKTRKEKYLAANARIGLAPIYTGPIPEPKTIDEYYTALKCGFTPEDWGNSNQSDKPPIGGNINEGGGAQSDTTT